jgi:hypothetical protein
MGYRHTGRQMYLNANGKLRNPTKVRRMVDRFRGFWGGLRVGRFDHFADHSMDDYIRHIGDAIVEERDGIIPRVEEIT